VTFVFLPQPRRHSISTTVPAAEKSSPHENNNVPVAMKTEDCAEVEKKRNVDLVDAESNTVLTGMETKLDLQWRAICFLSRVSKGSLVNLSLSSKLLVSEWIKLKINSKNTL
jgi:hypothetical protein